ncbi:hypothetical protein D1007_57548 [Hordeum vulgare]|nr:hypothetical protein D1007_57548 [Hordeum vulgare]
MAMEMEISTEEQDLASYRRDWESSYGAESGSFESYTSVRAMLFTCKPTPAHAGPETCLQIFSVEVTELSGGLQWPLEVYGMVATRDSVDHNRNDPLLKLTGPSRAVVFAGPVDVEIHLKLKGRTTEREDKELISKVLIYGRDFGSDNFAVSSSRHLARTTCSSSLCSLKVTAAPIARAIEATVISAEVTQGRWPKTLGIRIVVSGTGGADDDEGILLLDARDAAFRVDLADGIIGLTRHVVCVEEGGRLKLCIDAYSKRTGCMYEKSGVTELMPKRSSATIGVCKLAFCTVEFVVGWSCLVPKVGDLMRYGI